MLTVKNVYDFINDIAPFDTQADFDNSGLLLGNPAWTVQGIHVALDCTEAVVDEAIALGANLIVTHHPLMFAPRKRLCEADGEARLLCRMIRANLALIAAHTSLDQAPGGINDVLATVCGLTQVSGEGYLRVGDLATPTTGRALAAHLSKVLHTTIRVMGNDESNIRRMAVSSGAGSDGWEEAHGLGADCFLSGEIKHHHALGASAVGMLCLEAGHFATETPGIFALADTLQKWQNAVQCSVCISKSHAMAYASSARL